MRVLATTAAVLVLVGLAPAAGAAPPAPCDPLCQQRENALPRTGFYHPPDPLSPRPPGTLIRAARPWRWPSGSGPAPTRATSAPW